MGMILFLLNFLGASLSQQLSDEFKAWTPCVVKHLVERALMRLPETERDRYREEWQSHIDDVPGHVGKLYVAFGLRRAATKMASILPCKRRHWAIRLGDLVVSVGLLIFLAPLLVLIAATLAIINGPRSVLEKVMCVNSNGEFRFYAYRFQSPKGLLGNFLERTSIAALPGLVSVLTGNMTIVGPRNKKKSSVKK